MYVSFMTLCTSVQLKNMYTSGHLPHCAATPSSANHTQTRRASVIRRIYKIGCSRLYFSARTGYKTSRIGATIAAAQLVREEGGELNLL